MKELLNASPRVQDFLPAGTIIPFAGNVELEGWSLCDGGELSRTEYSNLFNMIGTTYGEGDGSTTFNKPDYRDKTIWGSDTAGIIKQAGLPNITGDLNGLKTIIGTSVTTNNSSATGVFSKNSDTNGTGYGGSANNKNVTSFKFNASKSNSIYGNSTTVQPPAITVRMLIKL